MCVGGWWVKKGGRGTGVMHVNESRKLIININ